MSTSKLVIESIDGKYPSFGDHNCHEQLSVLSRTVASLAEKGVASQTPAVETVHM